MPKRFEAVEQRFHPGTFYGETNSLTIAEAVLSVVRHRSAVTMAYHVHEAGHFCLLLDGTYVEHSENVTVSYQPLTVAFLPPNVAHSDSVGEGGCRFFIIELQRRWMSVMAGEAEVSTHLCELHGGEATWLAMRLYNEYCRPELTSELTIESLLYELCGHIARMKTDESHEPEWLKRTRAVIHESYAQNWQLAQLATRAGVHPTHLARAFRRWYGRPVGEYVTGLRIQDAFRRLQTADLPLKTIAAETGFADQSHLTRVFKAVTGVTPAKYRQRAEAR